MKTIYTLLFLCISTLSFSQNWNVVNQNKTVFFKHSDSTSITNTIVIDSTIINGLNTSYYTGYAFKYCDTCQVGAIYRYAKELLGFTIEDDVTNNQYNLDNNTIKQHSQVNDNWAFNSNLTATTINTTEQLVLGVLDSIKTIELSNTDTIIISKNNGIIRYPDFENTGKHYEMVGYHEGQNSFGEYLPNFWRTYDFNVGDVLSYHIQFIDGWCNENYTASVKIIDNLSNGDTIKFLVRTLYNYHASATGQDGCSSSSHTHNSLNTILVINDKRRYENLYGVQFIDTTLSAMTNTNPIMNYYYNYNSEYVGASHFQHPIFGTTKRIHHLNTPSDSTFQLTEFNHIKYFSNTFGTTLLSPLPSVSGDYYSELVGAIINGDTTGTVYNFPDDLGFEENTIANTLEFYPNPANQDITFKTELAVLEIYSSTRQLVMTINQPYQVIDVSELPQGLYFIKGIDFENTSYTSKLIIKE
jgi:hypothetical protein